MALMVIAGCEGGGIGGGGGASASTEEATVKGTVKINGKPATKGIVNFDPSNINRKMEGVRKADIGSDGSYTVKTLVGGNNVSVNTPETQKDSKLMYNQTTFEVKSGENTLDIEVPTPAK